MTQISRRPLPDKFLKEIFSELSWSMASLKSGQEIELFLNEFLTSTEKVMLAKRFMVAVLILKGWHWSDICSLLHVSSSTVMDMKSLILLDGKGFKEMYKKLEKKERWENFWRTIDELLPPIPKGKSDMRTRAGLMYGKIPQGR